MIAHCDWIPIEGNVVAATEEIILSYTPSWPYAHGEMLQEGFPAEQLQVLHRLWALTGRRAQG